MRKEIRFAEKSDIPALCGIWKVCFGDTEEYARFFYRENFDYITTNVYAVDGQPVSMLHWIDASFEGEGGRLKAKYLYAGGTLPEYRGGGYYGALIRYVEDFALRNGYVLFGKPAVRELVPYYKTFGFLKDACFRLVSVLPGEKIALKARSLSPEEYNKMRDRAFSDRPYVKWEDRYVRYCVAECAYCGGRTLAVEFDGGEHFLMGAPRKNDFLINETDLSPEQLRRAGGALCALLGADRLTAYLSDQTCTEGEEIVSSVVFNAPLRNTYINLILI